MQKMWKTTLSENADQLISGSAMQVANALESSQNAENTEDVEKCNSFTRKY